MEKEKIQRIPFEQSWFKDNYKLRKFLEKYQNVFLHRGYIAGGFACLCLKYPNVDPYYFLTNENRREISCRLSTGRKFHHSVVLDKVKMKTDLDIWFESFEDFSMFSKKFIHIKDENTARIQWSPTFLSLENARISNLFGDLEGYEKNAETYHAMSHVDGNTFHKEKIQLVNKFFGTPEEVLSDFDLCNSMIGFNLEEVFFHEDMEELAFNNLLEVSVIKDLFRAVSRMQKYVAKYLLKRFVNPDFFLKSVHEFASVDGDNIFRVVDALKRGVFLSLFSMEELVFISSVLNDFSVLKFGNSLLEMKKDNVNFYSLFLADGFYEHERATQHRCD